MGFFLRLGAPALAGGGGTGFPFALFPCCNCLRTLSGSIPGIGVLPGLITTLAFLASGMPGVGVAPRGTFALPAAGAPGVEFPDGTAGLVMGPGEGLLELAVRVSARFAWAFAVLELVPGSPPQPAANSAERAAAVISNFFICMIPYSI